jgi:hypothetical protein
MISRFIFALVLTAVTGVGASPSLSEFDVKAAFLVNFARYVEWPPEAFHDFFEPLLICVLGRDPFGRALDDMVAGKSIEGRPVAVRRIQDARLSGACRVLFIGSPEHKPSLDAPGASPESGVLTVGEADGPVSRAIVISFTMETGKVRFTINMEAADREKLRLSSRLLGLASSVKR